MPDIYYLLLQPGGHDIYRPPQTVRQHVFVREEFRYLNVPRIGSYTVDDSIDCAFKCLSHTSCFSVNLAASRGIDGNFWCELLSSDKYRNSTELFGNKSSHHFLIKVIDILWEIVNVCTVKYLRGLKLRCKDGGGRGIRNLILYLFTLSHNRTVYPLFSSRLYYE